MKKWRFNEEFLKQKIVEGNIVLQKNENNCKMNQNVKKMIDAFECFLDNEKTESKVLPNNINYDLIDMINNLNNSINKNLNNVKLEEWLALKEMSKYFPKIKFEKYNSSLLPKSDEKLVSSSMKFFNTLDPKIYYAVEKIINHEYGLINIKKDKDEDQNYSFGCDFLNLPFINISAKNDMKYMVFAHELRHAADYYLYNKDINTNLSELSAIYSEIIFADKINKTLKCPNIYHERINNTGEHINCIKNYIEFLINFDKCGRKITTENFMDVLFIRDKRDFINKYFLLMKEKYMIGYDYIISTLVATSFREEYYNGNKELVNKKIEQILLGSKYKLNLNVLEDKYVNYVKEIKKLSYK